MTGPQLGTLTVLILLLVSVSGLVGYQAGVSQSPVDEDLLNPSSGSGVGGSAVLADMLASRSQGNASDPAEGVPPRQPAPELGSSLSDPNPDLGAGETIEAPAESEQSSGTSAEVAPEDSSEIEIEAAAAPVVEEPTPEEPAPEPTPAEPALSESVEVAEPSSAASPSVRPASEAPNGRGFTIQLAAYPSKDEAESLVGNLRGAGFEQAFYQVATVNGRTWYRVRVGVYRSRAEAESAAKRLAGASPYDPYITPHP